MPIAALYQIDPAGTRVISSVTMMHCSVTNRIAGDIAGHTTQGFAPPNRSLAHISSQVLESYSEYSQSTAKQGTGEIHV